MSLPQVHTVLAFTPEDLPWVRRMEKEVPAFFAGHCTTPALGDVLRIGGRQFAVIARVWEHDGARPLMRLYLGPGRADTDTVFHELG